MMGLQTAIERSSGGFLADGGKIPREKEGGKHFMASSGQKLGPFGSLKEPADP
jgi:hypothetical protein